MKSIVIKILISMLCLIGIFVLFGIEDNLLPNDVPGKASNQGSDYIDAFNFEPEQLYYDGTGDLDLLEGVSLKGYSAEEMKKLVYTRIYKGESLAEKVIEYTAETDEGKFRSTRPIKLYNYNGPKVLIPDDLPEITRKDSGHFKEFLMMKSGYAVDDGFGRDVKEYAEISYEEDPKESDLVHYSISFGNMFGDNDLVKVDVTLSGVPAYLALTEPEITLNAGDHFDPMAYVARAELADGTDALDAVLYNGNVNTVKKGEYKVTYDLEGEKLALIVHVI